MKNEKIWIERLDGRMEERTIDEINFMMDEGVRFKLKGKLKGGQNGFDK